VRGGEEGYLTSRIIAAVRKRWDVWDVVEKLNSVFKRKRRVIEAILEAGGSNEYKIPEAASLQWEEARELRPFRGFE